MSTVSARITAALRLAGVTVVLAAGIAGFATVDPGPGPAPVQLDLTVHTAVVTAVDAG